jgi:formylglycine-generating enzyme required for sulfatase activity
VAIPANPSFVFAADVSNRAGGGEPAPIETDYALAKYLVTNAPYAAFLAERGDAMPPGYWTAGIYPVGKADHPVLFVSAVDATAFCAWLSESYPGWTIRLPTEAEWENAACGPARGRYPWGNEQETAYRDGALTSRFNYNGVCATHYLATQPTALATYRDERSSAFGQSVEVAALLSIDQDGRVAGWNDHATATGFVYTDLYDALVAQGGFTTPVGAFPEGVGPYGQFDLAGNAFEWTSSEITATNGAESGQQVLAVRGGSWYATARSCTAIYRGEGRAPEGGYHSVGFRVAAVPA